MIDVIAKNHEFQFEVGSLVRVFYFSDTVNFVDSAVDSGQDILIENIWSDEEMSSTTKVYKSGVVAETGKTCLEDMDILEDSLKKRKKMCVKKNIYDVLSSYTGIESPWGILTGIRPTKIIHSLTEKGAQRQDILKMLKREYRLADEKIRLIEEIADIEHGIIYPLDKDRYSLYVSIPFCPTRCTYCSFPSNKFEESLADEYVEKLVCEIEGVAALLSRKKLDTVYIGGGTPTSISSDQLERIIKAVKSSFDSEIREFTVEAGRPDTITREKLEMLHRNGVGRISINPQTMNAKTLTAIERSHGPDDIVDKYNMAREIGFDSINMDIIVGLPGEGVEDVRCTMEELEKLDPENITVHTLALKKKSKVTQNIEQYELAEAEKIEAMLDVTREYAQKMGQAPYYMYRQKQILGNFENIGYSKPGKECIYNIMMMEEKQTIIALGAGGISKMFYPEDDRIERVPNVKDLRTYFERLDEMIDRKKIFR